MKITITQDFDTAEAAAVFLARVGNPAYVADELTAPPVPEAAPKGETKVARKPRADAGKTREPYGPRTTEPNAGAGTTTSSASGTTATGAVAGYPVATGGSPVTPTAAAPAPQPAAEEFPATLEGARAVMKKLNDAKGKGMDACIAALKAHGVNRISDLPKEKYGEFVKYVIDQLPKAK